MVANLMVDLLSSTDAPIPRTDEFLDSNILITCGAMAFLHLNLVIVSGILIPYFLNLSIEPSNFYLFNLISQIISPYTFVLAPALLFMIMYRSPSKHPLERVSSVLTSIIIGGVVGAWLGSIFAGQAVHLFNQSISLSPLPLTTLLVFAGFDIAIAYLAFFAPSLVEEWDARLRQEGLLTNSTKPEGILTLVWIFVISGVTTIGILPVVAMLYLGQSTPITFYVFLLLLPFILVTSLTLVLIGRGIFGGRRWGWLIALLSSAFGAVATLSLWYSLLTSMAWVTLLGFLYTGVAFSSFILNILTIALLQSRPARIHCRMISVTGSTSTASKSTIQTD